jgi:hypothetical protein
LRVAIAAGKFHGVTSTDPGRLVLHQNAGARRRCARDVAEVPHRLLGVPAEELGRISDLATGIAERLAVFQRDQLGEALGLPHDHFEGLAQDFATLARLAAGPAGESCLRGIHRGLGIVDAGARHRGDDVLGGGIDDVEALAVGRLAPLAADPQIGRDMGEEIFIHGAPL